MVNKFTCFFYFFSLSLPLSLYSAIFVVETYDFKCWVILLESIDISDTGKECQRTKSLNCVFVSVYSEPGMKLK